MALLNNRETRLSQVTLEDHSNCRDHILARGHPGGGCSIVKTNESPIHRAADILPRENARVGILGRPSKAEAIGRPRAEKQPFPRVRARHVTSWRRCACEWRRGAASGITIINIK